MRSGTFSAPSRNHGLSRHMFQPTDGEIREFGHGGTSDYELRSWRGAASDQNPV